MHKKVTGKAGQQHSNQLTLKLPLWVIHKLYRQARGDLLNVYAYLRGGRGSHQLVYLDKYHAYAS